MKMELYYPPVGIAHILNDITDLFSDRLINTDKLQVTCISQPKTDPHFGTMIVMFCTFALADRIRKNYKIETEVLIDYLENSPSEEINIDDTLYSRCISHAHNDGNSLLEINLVQMRELARWISEKLDLPFKLRPYSEIQSQKTFRDGLQTIINQESVFIPKMSPSEQKLRIRPICSNCGLVDKEAKTVIVDTSKNIVSFTCPQDGEVAISLADVNGIIDCNAPIRTVLRSLCFIYDKLENKKETIIVNGGDWAGSWMQRVYFDSLSNLGFSGTQVPFNIFTPQILDWSGAKLSKTIYLSPNAYQELDKAWLSVSVFREKFGEVGLTGLYAEIESWLASPAKFFRNYSIDYFKQLFEK